MSDRQSSQPEGYEVPVHQSLVHPILVAGLPRAVAFLYWTIAAAFILGMRQLWMIPLAILGHIGLAQLTRFDPYFIEVIRSAVKNTKDKHP